VELLLRGIGVGPGVAIGPALMLGSSSPDIPKYRAANPKKELERFDRAVDEVRDKIDAIRLQTAEEFGSQHAGIFEAHMLLLEDVALREELSQRLQSERWNIEFLVDETINQYAEVIQSAPDPRMRERAEDVVDIGKRILARLMHEEDVNLQHLEAPGIIMAHKLSPTEIANIDKVNTLGLVLEQSGATSHPAILARAFEIPTVVGIRFDNTRLDPGDTVVLDGASGEVVVHPDALTVQKYRAAQKEEELKKQVLLAQEAAPGTTLDEHRMATLVNIELPVELTPTCKARAQGVGLFRTEYLYLDRRTPPTEDEQFEAYAQVAETMDPLPVTIRTLDIGGDKVAPHLMHGTEPNPQLGWRAIRFCLDQPEIFKTQLRALLRASTKGDLRVMFPLISGVDQFRRVRVILDEVRADLERESIPFRDDVKIGTMIELPAAVEVADHLARECDFFSIGTNDLVQYALGVDRVNERIAHMYRPAHPAVLRMMRRTAKAAKAAKIPCTVCGEVAGDPRFTELLLGLDMDAISMSPLALPRITAELANLEYSKAQRFAVKALRMDSAIEIEQTIEKRLHQRRTMEKLLNSYERRGVGKENGKNDGED